MGIKHSTLHDWYKNHLSGFHTDKEQKELHHYDIPPPIMDQENIAVPIVKPNNVGYSMALDEKYINGRFYTLLTNNKTGKIALMAASIRKQDIDIAMQYLGDKRFDVKYLTRDLSNTFDWVGRTNFMNACHIADKFHVLRHLFESLHDLRIFHRQKWLTKKREAQQQARQENRVYKKIKEEILENGDSHAELLARSIYLLYKKKENWSLSQAARAKVLFKHYPAIEKAYQLTMQFRSWYVATNVGKCIEQIKGKLYQWYEDVEKHGIIELLNFKTMVIKHEGVICNYFINGMTNAKAEAINRVIQSVLTTHVSTRNINFAHFRIKKLLA